jgi:hypothetical protein
MREDADVIRRPEPPLVFAISAHQVLARALLTIGSMQQSSRCPPRYRIHEDGEVSRHLLGGDQAAAFPRIHQRQ